MKRMQKMSATKIIVLIRELNIENTLIARKNIIKIRKFKKLMIFKIIFKKNKKNIEIQQFLNEKCCFDNDFTTRKI